MSPHLITYNTNGSKESNPNPDKPGLTKVEQFNKGIKRDTFQLIFYIHEKVFKQQYRVLNTTAGS